MTEPNVPWKENDTLEAMNYDLEVPAFSSGDCHMMGPKSQSIVKQ